MADDTAVQTTPTVQETIATDHVTTLNGAAVTQTATSPKVQRVKAGYGDDGTYRDVSATFPLPIGNEAATAGSVAFTAVDAVVAAPDGLGGLVTGASTAGSVVALALPPGVTSSLFLIKGLTGAQTLYFEASTNSTNGTDGDWTDVKQRKTGTAVGTEAVDFKTSTNNYFRGNPAGFTWLRARLLGTFAGSPSAQIRVSSSPGAVFLNSGLPASSSTIGAVKKAPSTTGAITSVAAATSSTLLLAANSNRLGAVLFNDSTATLYLGLTGSAVSTTAYTVQVPAGGYYELPNDSLGYVGDIRGIWSAVNGSARITELT